MINLAYLFSHTEISSLSSSSDSSDPSSTSSADISSSATISSQSATITSSSFSSDSSTFSTTTFSSSTASSSSSSIISSSSTTQSSCLTAPTLTAATLPNCTPCAGQPGNDKFCGYDVTSNSYEVTPITCNVVYYNFDITGSTFGPDGVERPVMWVNGQMPGPALKASWGDTVVVTVNNKLSNNNGTSIHFHGIRQLNNNMNDGVAAITQCPIAPGSSMTYTWIAENYGTSWYHSHFAIQAWEGVMGPMIIDGPHSAEFDVDMGPFQLQDWSHFTADSRYDLAQNATPVPGAAAAANGAPATYGGPVLLDTGLINGMNIWNGDDQSGYVSGSRFVAPQTFTPGQKYLFRFINSAIQSTFKVYLDNHHFTVIATDFVPITPYTTDILNINIGQRYDVIIEATESTGSFFLRADNQNACAGTVQALDIRAIINYDTSLVNDGSTGTAYNYTGECVDEPMASLVPVAPMTVGAADVTEGALNVLVSGNSAQLYKWYISGTSFMAQYNDPTLLAVAQNVSLPTDSGALLIPLTQAKQWIYVIVQSPIPLPHPLHLHGHDFFILAEGSGSYDPSIPLTLVNPPRRDTALMPAAGFIVLAFETDNPGVWLMHCHIGWHTSMGFALQFVEMQDQIQSSGALKNSCALNSTCDAWNSFSTLNSFVQLDSGV
ncbi:hypothetical protein BLS_004937 [Venturia inaequalis]|uniref:Multicopper oxidase n=1 Tax=Venturia inaequalis TaxID=5025 RepID=A0A8H3V4Q3_VENIN|nr:hypothetical protein BLS_004937 [Venturia inaequalis]